MLKSFDESSISLASRLTSKAYNDTIICKNGNVLSLGVQFFGNAALTTTH